MTAQETGAQQIMRTLLMTRSSIPHPPTDTTCPSSTLACFSPLSPNEVLILITSHQPTTCPLDPIHSHLQSIAHDLLRFLSHLINASLTTGCFPNILKAARVNPLVQKPTLSPSDVENYRPVSLLPFLSKTLKRAVFSQLSMYLHQNNLLLCG